MCFRQFLRPDSGCASHLVSCQSFETAAIIEPDMDIDRYIREADEAGVRIDYVIDTHVHADHLSGARLLAEKTGARLLMHELAPVKFPFQKMTDGDIIRLGNTSLKVMHTPGHTPESTSLVASDKARMRHLPGVEPGPWFVLTGDTLFVGDVGRPDLWGPEGAPRMFETLHDRLMKLEDGVEVYPSHFSGSACGAFMSGKPSSTIGFERRFNPAMAEPDEKRFVKWLLGHTQPAPQVFLDNVKRNLGEA
ncbi:MAG: MBL fold metallo-hydrolase [Euryarchaeota archaeon]|nr:MBL fold metallo-hydrolase [Euryarchaeota archaeon]